MIEGETFKKRTEKKYRVAKSFMLDFINDNEHRLKNLLAKDAHHPSTTYTDITNIYFDTNDLKTYRESLEKKPDRYKLRIRSYAPDAIENDDIYFELKAKKNGVGHKERIHLKKAWLFPFLDNGQIDLHKVVELNDYKDQTEVLDLVNTISKLIHEQGHRPVVEIEYRRYAFKLKKSKKLRMTIDMDLSFKRLEIKTDVPMPYKKSVTNDQAIVELKYKDERSLELASELTKSLGEARGFSKYSFALHSTSSNAVKTVGEESVNV